MHLLFFHVRKATGGESACLIIILPDKQNPQKCRTFIRTRKHGVYGKNPTCKRQVGLILAAGHFTLNFSKSWSTVSGFEK